MRCGNFLFRHPVSAEKARIMGATKMHGMISADDNARLQKKAMPKSKSWPTQWTIQGYGLRVST
jgi:hypothetical protein